MLPKKYSWFVYFSKILIQKVNTDIMQNATFTFNNNILNKYLGKTTIFF